MKPVHPLDAADPMAESTLKSSFPPPGQPSTKKLAQLVGRADEAFTKKKLRFTPLRQQVFEEIASTHGSIGAYDILAQLAGKGTRLAPISIYRAIDALLEAEVIHRLESKNAFFACRRLEHAHVPGGRPLILACEKCGAVAEVPGQAIFDLIDDVAQSVDFKPRVRFVEVSGTCPRCARPASPDEAGGQPTGKSNGRD